MLQVDEKMARKVFLLAGLEPNIWEFSSTTPDDYGRIVGWNFQISKNIRVYRKVQSLEDYLAEYAKLRPQRIKANSGGATNPGRSAALYPVSTDIGFTPINAVQTQP
jgi:hypothetical protein